MCNCRYSPFNFVEHCNVCERCYIVWRWQCSKSRNLEQTLELNVLQNPHNDLDWYNNIFNEFLSLYEKNGLPINNDDDKISRRYICTHITLDKSVANISYAAHIAKGISFWYLKKSFIRLAPKILCSCWVYFHSCWIYEKPRWCYTSFNHLINIFRV